MLIVPAIDIIGGQCVRLTKGDYSTVKVYENDPVAVALQFEAQGITHLHLVDLDGAKAGEVINWPVLEAVGRQTKLHIDFSGGIKSAAAVEKAFSLGAKQVAIGSLAVKQPAVLEAWLKELGPDRFILAADVSNGHIATHGWQEQSSLKIEEFISYWLARGLKRVMCTDISKDGMLQGPAVALYTGLLQQFPVVELIASGGVGNLDDLYRLNEAGCYAAIVGKAIYEGRIEIGELKATI